MRKKLRKAIFVILAIISNILIPLRASCTRSKIDEEKKPSSTCENRGKLDKEQMFEIGKYFYSYGDFANASCINKKYGSLIESYKFNPITLRRKEDLIKFKNIDTYKFYSYEKSRKVVTFDKIFKNFKKIIFESGSIGHDTFKGIIEDNKISANESVWKKEVFPLEKNESLNDTSSYPEGFKLVLTNTENGKQVIFFFEFGNVSLARSRAEYSFKKDCKYYNSFADLVNKLNPKGLDKMRSLKVDISEIERVVISFEIENIKENSFRRCKNLNFVEVINNIFEVETDAFDFCENLKRVIFRGSVYGLGKHALFRCKSLKEVRFCDNLFYIGECCFGGCDKLKKINIPESVEVIYRNAFVDTPSDLKISYLGKEYDQDGFFKAFIARGGFVDRFY